MGKVKGQNGLQIWNQHEKLLNISFTQVNLTKFFEKWAPLSTAGFFMLKCRSNPPLMIVSIEKRGANLREKLLFEVPCSGFT